MSVSIDVKDRIAVVTIDNPPVNALSQAVRSGLSEAIDKTEADAAVDAVLLRCEGRTFVAGADVREFSAGLLKPDLPDVVLAIENASKPWVAALFGTTLGGGLELALGCTYRIAARAAKMGLPEVNLGIIPGAGGTVRLPRIVGPEAALDMIAGGKPIPADKALNLGLISRISDGDLDADALAFTRNIALQPKPAPLSAAEVPAVADPEAWAQQCARIRKRARGQISPIAATEAMEAARTLPFDAALAAERSRFLDLKASDQSRALRHVFFAERSATRLPELKSVPPLPHDHIGVVGGGTMGAGIAAACLLSGLTVTLTERDETALTAGHDRIAAILADSHTRGILSDTAHAQATARLTTSTDATALASADLIIEAVFEDFDVKSAVFAELDRVARPDAVLATNTSYLDVNALAAGTTDPSRVIGLHFFSPAHIMKLLEIVTTNAARPEVLATAFALGKRLKKITVPAGVCDGFIGNRIMAAYRHEADYMLEDGALPHQIDAAMRDFGFPMGVFQMQDLAGLDIAWAMRKRRATTRPKSERYVKIADRLCEAGRLGRKTGRGWYDYSSERAGQSDPEVTAIIEEESAAAGITRKALDADQVMDRILSTIEAEGRAILNEGIARSPEAIDVVMINGYGFPRWRGGPMFMADITTS